VTGVLAAVESGAFALAAALLARDAVVAVAAGEDHLHHAHVLGIGPEEGLAALARLGPGRITSVSEAVDPQGTWFGELARTTATARNETLLLSAAANRAGLIGRLLIFSLPAVERIAAPDVVPARPLEPMLERYFAALQQERFEDGAVEFGEHCLYSHPPYRAGAGRVLFRGRDGLVAGLRRERGSSRARQVVSTVARRGPHAFIEGVVEGVPHGGTFVSAVSLDCSGLIGRYVACYTAPPVPGGFTERGNRRQPATCAR
jgi:hypothetical protein